MSYALKQLHTNAKPRSRLRLNNERTRKKMRAKSKRTDEIERRFFGCAVVNESEELRLQYNLAFNERILQQNKMHVLA